MDRRPEGICPGSALRLALTSLSRFVNQDARPSADPELQATVLFLPVVVCLWFLLIW